MNMKRISKSIKAHLFNNKHEKHTFFDDEGLMQLSDNIKRLNPERYKHLLGSLLELGLKINYFNYPPGAWPPPTPARYYISDFLARYKKQVRGRCVEFYSPVYRDMFINAKSVSSYDVWNISDAEGVSIVADLQNATSVDDNYFDTIICTHVLSAIENPFRAVDELYRVLKPGGVVLCTVPSILQGYAPDPSDHWRFTRDSLSVLFKKYRKTKIFSYGNAATVAGSPYYLMSYHFSEKTLNKNDDTCPSILAVYARK